MCHVIQSRVLASLLMAGRKKVEKIVQALEGGEGQKQEEVMQGGKVTEGTPMLDPDLEKDVAVVEEHEERQAVALNTDRRLVLIGAANEQVHEGDGDDDDEEEEYVFEEDEAMQAPVKWLAVARYYSGQEFKTWVLFNELSKVWGKSLAVPVRDLGDNRFLVEFDVEWLWRKAVYGGPWTFRGDAVIFAPYDGFKRLSEVAIESVALWIRIYDIPVRMMIDDFVRSLAEKVGRVIEIGEERMDYKRVRVDFLLHNALVPSVRRKVKGFGVMEFAIKYEGVPHF